MTIIEQIATYICDNLDLGTLAENVFLGYSPDSPDSMICVLDTGGVEPDIHLPLKSPTVQIFIRDTSYEDGKTKLDTIRDGLHTFQGELEDGYNFFLFILAVAEGGHLGRDEVGRDLFSINFRCLVR